jgi:hypothetical protein
MSNFFLAWPLFPMMVKEKSDCFCVFWVRLLLMQKIIYRKWLQAAFVSQRNGWIESFWIWHEHIIIARPAKSLVPAACFVIALRPQTPKHIRGGWSHYTDTSEPVDGGVRTLQLWTTRKILSVKMDRENSITLLWPKWDLQAGLTVLAEWICC